MMADSYSDDDSIWNGPRPRTGTTDGYTSDGTQDSAAMFPSQGKSLAEMEAELFERFASPTAEEHAAASKLQAMQRGKKSRKDQKVIGIFGPYACISVGEGAPGADADVYAQMEYSAAMRAKREAEREKREFQVRPCRC